jgi:hypothetical protein
MKIINEKLTAFGFDTPDSIEAMSSVSYLAIIVELEDVFGVEFPDELLAENAFFDIEKLAITVQSILPKGCADMFRNIKIVRKKDFKYKELDEALTKGNQVTRMKVGLFVLIIDIFIILLTLFVTYRMSVYYVTIIGGSGDYSKIELACILIITYVLAFLATPIIHEFLHFIAIPQTIRSNSTTYILLALPMSIGVVNYECKNKYREVFISICPFIFLSGFLVVCRQVTNNPLLEYFLTLSLALNIGSSDADVIRAIYIMFKAPGNAKIFLGYILTPIEDAQMS